MRLLNVATQELEEFHGADIPPYAILSHTWGPDEVSLYDMDALARYRGSHGPQPHLGSPPPPPPPPHLGSPPSSGSPDVMKLMLISSMLLAFRGDKTRLARSSAFPALTNGHGSDDEDAPPPPYAGLAPPPPAAPHPVEQKAGYAKIAYACGQAQKDGLDYLWADTVCIDRHSSAELSEAVNAMYAWYERAAVCYAYLEDVHFDDYTEGYLTWNDLFAASRWFTRGWTLQELLAPRKVVFYAQGWRLLGTKSSLVKNVSKITGIDELTLLDPALVRTASVAQRMSWAAHRSTTRPEDVAYSLMGLFDVNMPVLYGEGENAFLRLQEEIIKRSDDHSLFAWGALGQGDDKLQVASAAAATAGAAAAAAAPHLNAPGLDDLDDLDQDALAGTMPLLAKSPRDFAGMGHVLACSPPADLPTTDYALTNKGLHITLPMLPPKTGPSSPSALPHAAVTPSPQLALLNCHPAHDPTSRLALLLTPTSSRNTFLRTRARSPTVVSSADLGSTATAPPSPSSAKPPHQPQPKPKTIYIPAIPSQLSRLTSPFSSSALSSSSATPLLDEVIFVRAPDLVAPGYDVLDVRGAGSVTWNPELRSIRLAGVDYHSYGRSPVPAWSRRRAGAPGALYQLCVVTFWNRVLKCGFVVRVLVEGASRVCFADLVPGADAAAAAGENGEGLLELARKAWERPGTVDVVVPGPERKRLVTVEVVNPGDAGAPSGADDEASDAASVSSRGGPRPWTYKPGHEVKVAERVTFAEKWEKEYRRTVNATVERRKKGVIELSMTSMLWMPAPAAAHKTEDLDQPS
ncbi:hypothetical protein VTJ83DRAFT_115 [Remersonia thermophila]|uniref:Heterokaryon incompatibility domain-containing protein n=1 Tax=Remersonia thermophila TaxID=72144 RepID=A0ABR4DK57_9PEZI